MKRLGLIVLCWAGHVVAQPGVMDPAKAGEFTVADCFKNKRYSGIFKADSIKPNYSMQGTQVWRSIMLENKQNGVLFSSNSNCTQVGLFEIIKFGLFEKQRQAFASDDFNGARSTALSQSQVLQQLSIHDTAVVKSFDANGDDKMETIITNRYLQAIDITGYLLKEDWVMNSHSGQLEKYVVGFAPLAYNHKKEKVLPLFWLYYPEWRELLGCFEAQNFYSYDRITYKDVFEKKYFISSISKQSNVEDKSVRAYKHADDASLESEAIKERLKNSETDLFEH